MNAPNQSVEPGSATASPSGVDTRVLNLLAEAVRSLNGDDGIAAETYLKQALATAPDNPVACFLLGTVRFQQRDWSGAEHWLRRALSSRSGPAMSEHAEASRQDAAELAMIEYYLGLSLKFQRRYAKALNHLNRAKLLAPRNHQIQGSCAVALQHLQRFDDAIAVYEQMLALEPLDLATHLQVNELLYRQGRDERFLRSYDEAARKVPESALPLNAKGQFLLKAGRPHDAHEAFRQSLQIAPQDAATLTGLAHSLEALGDLASAQAFHDRSVLIHPRNPDTLVACAGFLLRSGDPRRALDVAARALAVQPADQAALALLGLCYRAFSDEREHLLNDYGSFVRVIDVDAPDGYADMEVFNRDLASYLDGLHGDVRENFTQTLRGGTRLYDELFYNGHDLVDRLRVKIEEAIRRYIATLNADAAHPFTSRRAAAFSYSGSWSSRIAGSGFHVNHIHPAGWISSAYYVAVPEASADGHKQPGWLKFGEPTDDFDPSFTARLTVQPKPGRLVLFPSYMWHGTLPCHSPQNRTTIAFDVVPVRANPR
jgi:tetratricopeptide (TPR) repeat protein